MLAEPHAGAALGLGPCRRQLLVGDLAGDDVGRLGRRGLIVGDVFLGARRTAGAYRGPEVGAVSERGHRLVAEQNVVKDAVADMLVEVGRELGIVDPQTLRRIDQPSAVDHAVLRILHVVGQPEHGLGRRRQIVADLAREARHHAEPEGHVGDVRRREARVDPVDDLDVDPRHHEARVDQRRLEEPVDPRPPVAVERDDDAGVRQPHDHDDLDQALVAALPRPCGDRVEDVDDVFAAADREDLDRRHRVPPAPAP